MSLQETKEFINNLIAKMSERNNSTSEIVQEKDLKKASLTEIEESGKVIEPIKKQMIFDDCSELNQPQDKNLSQLKNEEVNEEKMENVTDQQFAQKISQHFLHTCHKQHQRKTETTRAHRKDQNRCKKVHSIVRKIMKKLKIYHNIQPFYRYCHRLEFFIVMLMFIKKQNQINQFSHIFKSISDRILSKLQEMREKESIQKIVTSIHDWKKYLKVKDLFMNNQLLEALRTLFDVGNIRNKNFLNDSLDRSVEFFQSIVGKESKQIDEIFKKKNND